MPGKCFHGRRCKYAHTLRELEVGFVYGDTLSAKVTPAGPKRGCAAYMSEENHRSSAPACSLRERALRRSGSLPEKAVVGQPGQSTVKCQEVWRPPSFIDGSGGFFGSSNNNLSRIPHSASTPLLSYSRTEESPNLVKTHDRALHSYAGMTAATARPPKSVAPVRSRQESSQPGSPSMDAAKRSPISSPYRGNPGLSPQSRWFLSLVAEEARGAPQEDFSFFSPGAGRIQEVSSHAADSSQLDSSFTSCSRHPLSGSNFPRPQQRACIADPCKQNAQSIEGRTEHHAGPSLVSADDGLPGDNAAVFDERWLLDGRISTSTAASFSNRGGTPASSRQTEEGSRSVLLPERTELEAAPPEKVPGMRACLCHPQPASLDWGGRSKLSWHAERQGRCPSGCALHETVYDKYDRTSEEVSPG